MRDYFLAYAINKRPRERLLNTKSQTTLPRVCRTSSCHFPPPSRRLLTPLSSIDFLYHNIRISTRFLDLLPSRLSSESSCILPAYFNKGDGGLRLRECAWYICLKEILRKAGETEGSPKESDYRRLSTAGVFKSLFPPLFWKGSCGS